MRNLAPHLSKHREAPYEIRATGYVVTRDDSRSNAGKELLARDDLLSHEMPASFGLDLIFDVQSGNACPGILCHGARDVCRSTEPGRDKNTIHRS